MPDLEEMGNWFAYLSSCLSNNIQSAECHDRWSVVVLASLVAVLLVIVGAGYIFYYEHRKYERSRSRLRIRDVAAMEEIADEEAEKSSVRMLSGKYSSLVEKSGLTGWRIFRGK